MQKASLLIVLFVCIIAFAAPVQAGPGHFCENDDPDKEVECLNKYAPATPDYKQAYQPAYQPLYRTQSIDMAPAHKAPKVQDEPLQVFLRDYSSIKDPRAKLALLKQMRASAKEAVKKGQPKNLSTWEAPLPLSYTILDADLDKNIIDEETLNEFKTFWVNKCDLSGTQTINNDVVVVGTTCTWTGNITINGTLSVNSGTTFNVSGTHTINGDVTVSSSACYWNGDITINGKLTVSSGANLHLQSTSTVMTEVTVTGNSTDFAIHAYGNVYLESYISSPYNSLYLNIGQGKRIHVTNTGGLISRTSSDAKVYFYGVGYAYWNGIQVEAGGDIDFLGGTSGIPGTRPYNVSSLYPTISYLGDNDWFSGLLSVKGTLFCYGSKGLLLEGYGTSTTIYFDSNIMFENNRTCSNYGTVIDIQSIKVDEAIKIYWNKIFYDESSSPININNVEAAEEIDAYGNNIDMHNSTDGTGVSITNATYGSGKGIWVGANYIEGGSTGVYIENFSVNTPGGWCGGPNVYSNTLYNNEETGVYIEHMLNPSRCTTANYFSVHNNTISREPTLSDGYGIKIYDVDGFSGGTQNVWFNTISDFPVSIYLRSSDYLDVESNNLSGDGGSYIKLLYIYNSDYTTVGGSLGAKNNFGVVDQYGYHVYNYSSSAVTCSYNHFDPTEKSLNMTCIFDQ